MAKTSNNMLNKLQKQLYREANALFKTDNYIRFFDTKLTRERARFYMINRTTFVLGRRASWAYVQARAPFDVKQRYITEINDVKMETFIDWMKSCYYITVTGHPAISVPCGFTREGLPVGIQIIGRYRDDFGVLQLAHVFEQATQVWKQRPAAVG